MQIRCAICGKPTVWTGNPYRPFCSERCKLIDLGKWFDEGYRIPGDPEEKASSDEDGNSGEQHGPEQGK